MSWFETLLFSEVRRNDGKQRFDFGLSWLIVPLASHDSSDLELLNFCDDYRSKLMQQMNRVGTGRLTRFITPKRTILDAVLLPHISVIPSSYS